MEIDRSTEALLARRALAEQATPGEWHAVTSRHNTAPFIEAKMGGWIFGEGFDGEKDVYVRPSDEDIMHIAANSPDVVMADIDEILRLRAEVKKTQEDLRFANKIAAEQHEVAKRAWGGEIPSPLPGHRSMTEDEVVAMFDHLNCPWCKGSGHVGDCKEADQQVKARLERLEKEADWLAQAAANDGWHGIRVSPAFMREQARKAVEEGTCPKI